MPDREYWSASMLLHWVLARDSEAVLSMLADYGGLQVFDDGSVEPTRPQTWDDVFRADMINTARPEYRRAIWDDVFRAEMIDTTGPEYQRATWEAVFNADMINTARPEDQRAIWANYWSEKVRTAKTLEIYDNLRTGKLEARGRPNGTGNYMRIDPIQWTGLRLFSFDGRDLAVPVNYELTSLAPRPLSEYLTGSVPATKTPTVWPDPVFSAAQAKILWPNVVAPSLGSPKADHAPTSAPRARGRIPKKRNAIVARMRADIASEEGRQKLSEMTEKQLAHQYDACRDTVRKARATAESLFVENSNKHNLATNDK